MVSVLYMKTMDYAIHILLAVGCYSQPGCMGDMVTVPGPSARDCCVGTDDGLSYSNDSETCIVVQCVGKYE